MSGRTVSKVLVLHRESLVAPGAPSLSVSARITEVLDYLTASGQVEYCAVSENDPCVYQAVRWADVVILSKHRSAMALQLVRLSRSLGKVVIYDIDDWIFSFPSYSGGGGNSFVNHTLEIISLSDFVTVANAELMRRLPEVIPQASLVLLPNGMWVERYDRGPLWSSDDHGNPRVLFTNADFLKFQNAKDEILTALNVFFMRHPDWVLDFFGDPFPEMFSLPFLHFTNRMPYQAYMGAILSGSYIFAITPLGSSEDVESSAFNACKNPFKFINYGTARIPGIYSSAKIYTDCIEHGKTGLLVENKFEAWLGAMELFARDAELRSSVAESAHEVVKRNFNVRDGAQVLLPLINKYRCSTFTEGLLEVCHNVGR